MKKLILIFLMLVLILPLFAQEMDINFHFGYNFYNDNTVILYYNLGDIPVDSVYVAISVNGSEYITFEYQKIFLVPEKERTEEFEKYPTYGWILSGLSNGDKISVIFYFEKDGLFFYPLDGKTISFEFKYVEIGDVI